jgi:predicted PurR-regulated permease PerM
MSEVVLFTIVAIALYFFSDWLLRRIERYRGEPFKHRQAVYFAIILVLTMGSFELIGRVLQSS